MEQASKESALRLNERASCAIDAAEVGAAGGMESLDAEIRHARYIMSRLLLDCLRLIDKVRLQSGQLTKDESIIGVIVLEYEGQHSTSISKLSFFTGVPRATVGRIVDHLLDMGLVRRVGRKVAYAHPIDETAVTAARKFLVLMDEAAQELAAYRKPKIGNLVRERPN